MFFYLEFFKRYQAKWLPTVHLGRGWGKRKYVYLIWLTFGVELGVTDHTPY